MIIAEVKDYKKGKDRIVGAYHSIEAAKKALQDFVKYLPGEGTQKPVYHRVTRSYVFRAPITPPKSS